MLAGRILFLLFVFALPYILFALYLLATRAAAEAGRRKWPVQALFAAGVGLALIAALWMILTHPRPRDMCLEPERVENGRIIPARTYPCERDLGNVGAPAPREPSDAPR